MIYCIKISYKAIKVLGRGKIQFKKFVLSSRRNTWTHQDTVVCLCLYEP